MAAYRLRFEDKWPELKSCIEKIMRLQAFSSSMWQSGIGLSYSLCVSLHKPSGDRIYGETQKMLEDLVASRREQIGGSVDFLATYDKCWKEYHQALRMVHTFLIHVNTYYVGRRLRDSARNENKNVLQIYDLGLELWKTNLLQDLKEKLSWFLSEELKNDRTGKCSNAGTLQSVIKSLFEIETSKVNPIQVYTEIFEERFLSDTGEYYRIQVDRELQKNDCSQYMKKVLQWMNDEVMRCRKFLHPSTVPKVREDCLRRMVIDRTEYLQTEFKKLIPQERKTDYQNVYTLLKLTKSGLDGIVSPMEEYITEAGCTAMRSVTENNPEVFVQTFLQVREKYLNLIKECFDSDKKFIAVWDKACATILKCEGHQIFANKAPELLVAYCDRVLRKNAKDNDEADIDQELSQAIIIFTYIQDKDIFQRLYSQMLCKRLLHGPSESLYVEEIMISKLKQTTSHEFTKKYHEMFTDINLKKNLSDEFAAFIRNREVQLGLSFDAAILRTASWPSFGAPVPFAIPQVLEKCITEFEIFYNRKYSGRKLQWLHRLSGAEVKLCYLRKPYIISMTAHQMVVLLLFEHVDQLMYAEIKESTELEDNDLDKVTRSLVEARLLVADDESTDNKDSVYTLNKKYSNKKIKFKIPAVARKDKKQVAQEEVKKIRESAADGRRFALDAAIVRVMKARKTLNHNALIEEVIKQVSHYFVPKIPIIKKCIDGLIDRNFLERDPDCANVYQYRA